MTSYMSSEGAESLLDLSISKEAAIASASRMLRREPMLDLELAKLLPKRSSGGNCLTSGQLERAIDVLAAISPTPRLVTVVSQLVDDESARVRSKAASFVGRRMQNLIWATTKMRSPDSRIRASVVEALWESALPNREAVFYIGLADADARVAGNSAYGLYQLLGTGALPAIEALSQRAEPEFRRAAAWVIMKTKDPGLVAILSELLRDDSPIVRKSAFAFLLRLKRAA